MEDIALITLIRVFLSFFGRNVFEVFHNQTKAQFIAVCIKFHWKNVI